MFMMVFRQRQQRGRLLVRRRNVAVVVRAAPIDRLRTVEVDVRVRYHLVGGEGRWGRRCRHRLLPEKGTVRAGADAATHPQLVLLGRVRPQADAQVKSIFIFRCEIL